MTTNSFGSCFRFTEQYDDKESTVAVIIEGCPKGLTLQEADLLSALASNKIKIIEGVANGQTNGATIRLQIEHAPSNAAAIAAGVVAKKILGANITIKGATIQVGPHLVDRSTWDWNEVNNNALHSPNPNAAKFWNDYLGQLKDAGLSIGAVIEIAAEGLPAGLGQKTIHGLDSSISSALFSINGVKGVEIGNGFASAIQTGDIYAEDQGIGTDGHPIFMANNSGGIQDGCTTGQNIVVRYVVKPTDLTQKAAGDSHHPCVGILTIPLAESILACVLADATLAQK